ncbi:hypothetical protein [Bacillus smithii]|uniref:hypothetical protein n=1 Tax=Bacillus smithii TaxID=1479 RepID=UPI002E1CCA65|nr:hypothetical protein [Bacillus smithii]MED4929174.1 hypothetical protein [Bacillus smithii]
MEKPSSAIRSSKEKLHGVKPKPTTPRPPKPPAQSKNKEYVVISEIERDLLRQGLLDLYVNSDNFDDIEKEIFINLYHRIG